jgi:hypothetical protein
VETCQKKAPDLSKACVWEFELWRHADDESTRESTVRRLVKMVKGLIAKADDEGLKLAPFIGIAGPGVIESDGAIEKGAQDKQQVQFAPQVSSKRSPRSASTTRPLSCITMGRAGVVRGPVHAGRETLGCFDDWRRARQRPLHQPQRQGVNTKPWRRGAGSSAAAPLIDGPSPGLSRYT